MKHLTHRGVVSKLCLASGAILICLLASSAPGQTRQVQSPFKVGTIKDYPATGLMTGCGNLYFFKTGAKMSDATYVFLARGDGSNAWMNLNGRDVRLRQIKSSKRGSQKPRRYSYVSGQTRISVTIESVKPKPDGSEPEHMYKMTITVRRAGAVKLVHAVGDADC